MISPSRGTLHGRTVPLAAPKAIEEGYLSYLVRMFGSVEFALAAYDGGPTYARRYVRGDALLYDETREYGQQMLTRLREPR